MSKTKKTILIVSVSLLVLALSATAAYAAVNISNVEQQFLEFRSAQAEQAVENGDMTQDQADSYLENLTERMETDETDAVPPIGSERRMGARPDVRQRTLTIYSEVSGQDVDEIIDTLRDADITLFALADQEGLLGEFKVALLSDAYEHIDQMLADGRMDADEAAAAKDRVEQSIMTIDPDSGEELNLDIGDRGGMGGQGGMRDSQGDRSADCLN